VRGHAGQDQRVLGILQGLLLRGLERRRLGGSALGGRRLTRRLLLGSLGQ